MKISLGLSPFGPDTLINVNSQIHIFSYAHVIYLQLILDTRNVRLSLHVGQTGTAETSFGVRLVLDYAYSDILKQFVGKLWTDTNTFK